MPKYLYSSPYASFVFTDDFKLIERINFGDILKTNTRLEQGEWLPEEEELIKKHNPQVYIGVKKAKKEGLVTSQDPEKLYSVLQALNRDYTEFYSSNMQITKSKLKAAVSDDILIIQCIDTIDSLNKAINTLVKRLREWYGLYNPEFSNMIEDHERFVELILKNRKEELLKTIGIDQSHTMGADLVQLDTAPILGLADKISILYRLRSDQTDYLTIKMQENCPNMSTITGYLLGAKLIAYAGSLKRLAEMPSSTIQLLGAEKALFRHITKKSLPPKYGVLHEHPFISRSKKQDHGRVARLLADKISLAIKIDYFKGSFIGDKLKAEIERKMEK